MGAKVRNRVRKLIKSSWFMGCAGLIVGALVILGIRLATYKPADDVHYHANFAVYINGQRQQFKDPFYYIDVEEACTAEQQMTPHERAHMHDNINDVVHVEDHAVTWGQFFQNIGWVVDNRMMITPTQNLPVDGSNKVSFVLNGQQADNVINQVIKDQGRLLVDYGSTPQVLLQQEYATVPATAHKYDVAQDPASCSGHKTTTMRDRMDHMF